MQNVFELAKKNYGRTWTIEMLQTLVSKGKLTVNEYVSLTDSSQEDLIPSLDIIKASKLNELSTACEEAIAEGIDVTTSLGAEHFSLEITDQLDINNQIGKIIAGAAEVPYHADGKICRMFSAEEMTSLGDRVETFITYNRTYFNYLKAYVLSLKSIVEVNSVVWGTPLPSDLDSWLLQITGQSSKKG